MAVSAPRALDTPAGRVDSTIAKAIAWLDRDQTADGFWVGMLESNYCMEAEWLLAMHFLGYKHPRQRDLVATLLNAQRPDGSWEAYYDAPQGDINGTVECYAALRSVGMSADDEPLVRARRWIFEHGGLRGIRVFTRYWLALLGEWPWSATPNLPPEVIANPRHWFPFDIYNFASWARATLLPLAVLSARRAVRPLPPERRLDELFPDGREQNGLPSAAARPAALVASAVPAIRPFPASVSAARLHAVSRDRDQRLLGVDRAPPGRRRRMGRHSAAVDLQPHGAERRRVRARRIP